MDSSKPTHFRWYVFAAVLVLCAINYFDRAVLSICMPLIQKDLHFSAQVVGIILSSFFWGYTLMQVPIGWICDRIAPGKVITLSGILWAICQICTGLVSRTATLLCIRTLLGIAESPMYPGGTKLQSVWLPSTERGRGAAMLDSGSALGIALGGPIIALFLAWLHGWRGALIAAGVLTLVVVLLCYRVMTSDPDTSPHVNQAERDYIKSALTEEYEASQKNRLAAGKLTVASSEYVKSFNFWAMILGFYCFDSFWFGFLTWGPLYLFQTQHLKIMSIGWAVFVIYCCALIGEFSGGYISDKWRLSGANVNTVVRTTLGVLGLIQAICMYLLSTASTAYLAILLIAIGMFCHKWAAPMYWIIPAAISQRQHVGTVTGFMNLSGNLGGVLTPICIGLVVGATGSYFWVMMMFVAISIIAGLFPLLLNLNKKIGSDASPHSFVAVVKP
jgi:ACS family D-galactonate transporter-like MFS transporter